MHGPFDDKQRGPRSDRQGSERSNAPALRAQGLIKRSRAADRGAARAARDELVAMHMPLIGGMARRYRGAATVCRDELTQEGVVGLLRALERYDQTLDTPFWVYASWWVRQAMQQLVAEVSRPVVLSDRAARQLARVNQARRDHMQANGREPTLQDVAAVTGLERVRVEELIAAERRPRGLEETVGAAGEGHTSLGEMLADPRAQDAFDHVSAQVVAERLPRLLAGLDARERVILEARFGLEGPQRTLREVGAELGVSAERVRQIEQQALAKLRATEEGEVSHRVPPHDRRTRPGS